MRNIERKFHINNLFDTDTSQGLKFDVLDVSADRLIVDACLNPGNVLRIIVLHLYEETFRLFHKIWILLRGNL